MRLATQGHERLTATEFTEIEHGEKRLPGGRFIVWFRNVGRGDPPGDFLSENFDLETLLLEWGIKAIAQTDSCAWRDSNIDKNTSWRYNYFSIQYVGNYRNWVFAQQVNGWSISSYKANFDLSQQLEKESLLLVNASGNLPKSLGAVYNWCFSDIKMSGRRRLEIPCQRRGKCPRYPLATRNFFLCLRNGL